MLSTDACLQHSQADFASLLYLYTAKPEKLNKRLEKESAANKDWMLFVLSSLFALII